MLLLLPDSCEQAAPLWTGAAQSCSPPFVPAAALVRLCPDTHTLRYLCAQKTIDVIACKPEEVGRDSPLFFE